MKAITVGLIPSPDMPNKLIDKVINQLEETFKSNIDSNVDWHFEQEVAPMIGTSEHMDETLDLIKDKKIKTIGIMLFVSLIYRVFLVKSSRM